MFLQHWERPWAWLDTTRRRYVEAQGGDQAHSVQTPGWLCVDDLRSLRLDGRSQGATAGADFSVAQGREIVALPLPLRHGRGALYSTGDKRLALDWHPLPERPADRQEPGDDGQRRAKALLDRVKAVWARIREVEEALATPATMWQRLEALWLHGASADPEMDLIVQQSRELPPILEHLDKAPRRILRRTSRMIPLARVQEMDRKAMLWLARQPGETIAQRAGDRQRIQAVAREENFDTLENRVLLSYAALARQVAEDYARRHHRSSSTRVKQVRAYADRCRRLQSDLQALGVRPAGAEVRPNFVLQNNWHYHQVWIAWHALMQRHRALDELWRWQGRSWEELCALTIIVAAQSIPGAQPVALSPVVFREEQDRGCWLDHVNPTAVFFLPEQRAVLEIAYREYKEPSDRSAFGAAVWLKVGWLDCRNWPDRWPVWPLWSADGGLERGENEEIQTLLSQGRRENVRGGITLRPVAEGVPVEAAVQGKVACLTMGAAGQPLAEGIAALREVLIRHVLGAPG